MNNIKTINLVSTGLLTLMMLGSAGMYIFKNAEISQTFEALGYPSYVVIPLAIAKVLGLIAIWNNKSFLLKEWAYAGFFFDFVLAFFAHFVVGDGEYIPALVSTIILFVSYWSYKKLDTSSK
jgi:hypothetical protein